MATFCVVLFLCSVFLIVLVRLSVPVQVIDWKDSSLKCVGADVKLYSLTHSLTLLKISFTTGASRRLSCKRSFVVISTMSPSLKEAFSTSTLSSLPRSAQNSRANYTRRKTFNTLSIEIWNFTNSFPKMQCACLVICTHRPIVFLCITFKMRLAF